MQNSYFTTKGKLDEIIHSNNLYGQKIFVDGENGSDNNDGLSWMTAKATIQAGLNLARYDTGTTNVNDDKDHCAYVFVAPGHYNEAIAFSGYNVHLIGLGSDVVGKDYGVSVNYDGSTTTNAGIAFGGSGNSIQNIHVYMGEALPAIWCNAGDNNLIKNCVCECDGSNATYGIHMDSMKGSKIEDCVIINPLTSGIYVKGGAGVYAINGHIKDNKIIGAETGVKGIEIENTVTAYNFLVSGNTIDIESGGATSVGIENASTGNVTIVNNNIIKHASATSVSTGGSSAVEGDLEEKIDTIDTVVDGIKAVTDNLPNSGAVLGTKVNKTGSAILDGSQNAVFTVAGGRVLITHLEMENETAVLDNTTSNVKFVSNPTSGTDRDLCATLDVDSGEVGAIYAITGEVGTALTGGVAGGASSMISPVIVAEGTIDISSSASVITGGATQKFECRYIPFDDGATVVSA